MPRPAFWSLLALVALAALWLRVHELARRPMHADEANQALKAGELLEQHRYAFDPKDHHGPTLYYLTVPVAWIRGQHTLAALDETTIRLVPALSGTFAAVLLALLLAPTSSPLSGPVTGRAGSRAGGALVAAGEWRALAAAAFVAVSPAAVYYSRDFIQETLLLTFSLATAVCAQRWWVRGRAGWAIGAGVCLGLALATKEIAGFVALAAIGAVALARPPRPASSRIARDVTLAVGATLALGVAFYSSFGRDLHGLRDALSAIPIGWSRAVGDSGHEKPWWYYLQLFGWHRAGGLWWDQLWFSALALGGLVVAVRNGGVVLRAAAWYTMIVTVAISAVPYKTPWHAIHLVPGLAILAASGLAAIASLRTGRIVAVAFGLFALASLTQQTWRAAFTYAADPRNPFAYVHSSPDVLKFRPLVEAALVRDTAGPVRVIGSEYWPLPWYLRGLPRVGYWNVPPAECDGALVIASADVAETVRSRLNGGYRETFLGLRPGYAMVVFSPSDTTTPKP